MPVVNDVLPRPPLGLALALLGPESSGKSTLARDLASTLTQAGVQVALVEEYARAYYAERPYRPTLSDVEAIARTQREHELSARLRADLVLCDTAGLTTALWAEVGFGHCPRWLAEDARRPYLLRVLVLPDIPWSPDPLRSHPHARWALLERHRDWLRAAGLPWTEVGGSREARVASVLAALRMLWPSGLPKI